MAGGQSDIFQGLDFWSPNINIFRDPRWGRGQETYGEDPFLTGRMAVAFVTGMQDDNDKYYRTIATPKHFAVHSGPEPTRHSVDVKVSKHDEEDTYLPAFRAAFLEGKADSVMCAYNSINGQPACANDFLLLATLKQQEQIRIQESAVQQNLVTSVIDINGNTITGLSLDYQSTDPIDISVNSNSAGAITASYPGVASVYAICQPPNCNPSPINEVGLYGTGLSVSSNPVSITVPGTASEYLWLAAPGQSQYFVPGELLTGTVGSTVRLPFVPNSMVMDKTGDNLYFGSSHELMQVTALTNTLSKQDPSAPGVVLAVSPDSSTVLINDQVRQLFYVYAASGGVTSTFGGMGNAASWTPDGKTLYITDSTSLGAGHTNTLYVYSQNTGWSTYDLSASGGAQNLALTIPSVGAFLSGNSTVAHTWCPTGTVGNSSTIIFYPQGASVAVRTDVLAATTDGQHILGAAVIGGGITLSDIRVSIPNGDCPGAGSSNMQALTIPSTLNPQLPLNIHATAVNQVVTSPASNLAFVTYSGTTPGALLPYYQPQTSGAGTVNYLTLTGSSAITAPLAGAFSPDNKLFFVSTAGDNQIHYISIPASISTSTPLTDTQQISPNLPACTPGTDPGCLLTAPTTHPVPATVITVKPRSIT